MIVHAVKDQLNFPLPCGGTWNNMINILLWQVCCTILPIFYLWIRLDHGQPLDLVVTGSICEEDNQEFWVVSCPCIFCFRPVLYTLLSSCPASIAVYTRPTCIYVLSLQSLTVRGTYEFSCWSQWGVLLQNSKKAMEVFRIDCNLVTHCLQ